MTQNKPKPYTRLNSVAFKALKTEYVLSNEEKRDFADAVRENITPYEAAMNISSMEISDIWYFIYEDYYEYSDIEISKAYFLTNGCDTFKEYIEEYGLPLPDRDYMIEGIISDIDEEEYINERYEYTLDSMRKQFEFDLSDEEIIDLFDNFVFEIPDLEG